MKTTVNFAVVGCGMLARSQHIPNIVRCPKTVLHTCCDLSDDALAECQTVHGAKYVTKDFRRAIAHPEVDAICIATTEKLRREVIEAAAMAEKPVYCEKPIAQNLKEMREIQQIVHQSKIPFCVGHNRRSSPAMQDAHRIFRKHMADPKPCLWRFDREGMQRPLLQDDGTAAMLVRINDDWYSWKSWVFDEAQAPHGPMLFEMTHFTDLCNWFLAGMPKEVSAMDHGMLNHSIIIRYESGELATLMMTANGTFGCPKELYEMFGNGGAVIVDHMLEVRTAGIADAHPRTLYPMLGDRHPHVGQEGGILGWLAKKQTACREAVENNDPRLAFSAEPDKGHERAMERFADQILGSGECVCGIDDAVLATRVAFAAIQSTREKRIVLLEEI